MFEPQEEFTLVSQRPPLAALHHAFAFHRGGQVMGMKRATPNSAYNQNEVTHC